MAEVDFEARPRVAVVDYGLGNIFSITQAMERTGLRPQLCATPDDLMECDAVVLPGVGAMPNAMRNLDEAGLATGLREMVAAGRPILGICLGMQLLFETGTEHHPHRGLGLIAGRVERLPAMTSKRERLLVPHIGWSAVEPARSWKGSLLASLSPGFHQYFVHSYVCVPEEEDHTLAVSRYGGHTFCSAVANGNVVGCQFHPERSGPAGLAVWREFRHLISIPETTEGKQ
jgi:imidazole glycerol-phosphate synthase subunit HisH